VRGGEVEEGGGEEDEEEEEEEEEEEDERVAGTVPHSWTTTTSLPLMASTVTHSRPRFSQAAQHLSSPFGRRHGWWRRRQKSHDAPYLLFYF
jgi:hypothetical protein